MNPYEAPRDVTTRPMRRRITPPFPILSTAITFAVVASAVALLNFVVLQIMGGLTFDLPHPLQGPIIIFDFPGIPLSALLKDWLEPKIGFTPSCLARL